MNTPNVSFNEIDSTFSAGEIARGRSGVLLQTKRGPVARPDILVTSWPHFQKLYGGLVAGNDATNQVKRALERGTALRVSRVVHYTDTANPESFDAGFATQGESSLIVTAGDLSNGNILSVGANSITTTQTFESTPLLVMQKMAAKLKLRKDILDAIVVDKNTLVVALVTPGTVTAGVSGGAALSVSVTETEDFKHSDGTVLFQLTPKYPGADYNNLVVHCLPGSNGIAGYFDIQVSMYGENIVESYTNLTIPGRPNVTDSKYLNAIAKDSQLVNVVYSDLSAVAAGPTLVPTPCVLKYISGTNGSVLTAQDYIGSSAGKTGLFAFDGIEDIMQIAVMHDASLVGIDLAAAAYAENRKDLQAFIHLEGKTEAQIAANRAATIDTSYVFFTAGGVTIIDPATGVTKTIPELGDVLGMAGYSEEAFGAWFSFSGRNRGKVLDALSSGNSLGADRHALKSLASKQVNVVIDRNGTYLLGSFTGQLTTSQLSFANVRRLHIYLKKSLAPVLERFLEEPNDFATWKQIYLAVTPFLDSLKNQRAMFDYRWEGDQFANSLDDLKINDPAEVSLGKYRVRLYVKDIVSLQEIAIDVNLTRSDVSFEDALTLVSNS